jgi:AcrR family transcriptional regulator
MNKDKAEKMPGRRERKKKQTREALESTALRLFKKKGYDRTTIEDITEAVDVSPRTFFRYFDSKEAVLFGDWREMADFLYNAIKSRPLNESPLVTLIEVGRELAEWDKTRESRLMLIKKLAADSKRIGDYERNVIYPEFEKVVSEALAERMGVDPADDPRPELLAAVGVAAWTTARRMWVESDGRRQMVDLLRETFDFVIEPEGRERKAETGGGRKSSSG